ncbi:MAG: L-threonylcarbamoyladenylate synthase [Actinomycetota bacterium]
MDDAVVEPQVIPLQGDPEPALVAAVGAVRAGGVIVVPTDTVYGIAANAFDPQATREIFRIKRRPRSLPLPVLVSRPRQAWALCSIVPDAATALASAFWPGALTMILPANTELEWDLGDGGDTLAVRMPHHPELLSLLERTGPLACTSANITGEPTGQTISEIADRLDGVALYLDGGASTLDQGSTIVDLTGVEPKIIREGPIGTDAVMAAIAAG